MTKSEAIEIIKRVDICANAAETARDMAEFMNGEEELLEEIHVIGILRGLACSIPDANTFRRVEPFLDRVENSAKALLAAVVGDDLMERMVEDGK